ncbi:MAG: hypothetical protein ACTSP4_08565 [Candidatus Hodarchaeales archaeon]
MSENKKCNKPEIRDSFKDSKCSKEQIVECHGQEKLDQMIRDGEI